MTKSGALSLILAAALGLGLKDDARAEDVDVTLVLAIDVSRSMSPDELRIQREGYAAAINHPDVIRAVGQGAYGRIAVTMFEWAADYNQREVFGWTLVENQADADRLSDIIRAAPTYGQSRTSISGAINHGVDLLADPPYQGFRKVIDISGDGPNNQGGPVVEARQKALDQRIVINGLPLMTQGGYGAAFNIGALDSYYADCVIGGPGSFLVPVNTWEQFPEAIRRKLVQEIGGAAPPKSLVVPASAEVPSDCMVGEKIWKQRQWMLDAQ
ncbi:DUF1194 domain-containing protein [Hoeflea marina]|nr:DUF1194 domain-containing protein [Hoeflea marina]